MADVVQYYPGYSQVQIQENLLVETITSITQANPMVVTTAKVHNYPAGVMITFLIPSNFGMIQLNGITAQVIAVTTNTLSVNIDSRRFTPFAAPSPLPSAYTPPSVIPVSSGAPLPPAFLPYGNENAFEGVVYNAGLAP